MLDLINKKNLIIGLGALVLILGLANVGMMMISKTRAIKPNTLPKASIEPAVDKKENLVYEFVGNIPSFDKAVSVYEVDGEELISKEKADAIALSFGLNDESRTMKDVNGNIYFYLVPNVSSLYVYTNPFGIVFENRSDKKMASRLSNIDEYINVAESFLGEFSLITKEYSFSQPSGYLAKVNNENRVVKVDNMEKADFVQIEFNIVKDNIPVLMAENHKSKATVLLTLGGVVKSAEIYPPFSKLKDIGTAELKPIELALDEVESGKGIISRFEDVYQSYTEISDSNILTANLNKVELVYLQSQATGMLQPYYRFLGKAEIEKDKQIMIAVLISAVDEKLYQQ